MIESVFMTSEINIYKYKDYRKFISDWIDRERKINRKFSVRKFNQSIGMKSASFLSLIIKKKRSLGEEGLYALMKGFGLSERQGEYFRCLVKYNDSKSSKEKKEANAKLKLYSKESKKMDECYYNLFSKWYYVAILELLRLDTKKDKNFSYIMNNLKPMITRPLIDKAIRDLKHVGVIEESQNHTYTTNYEMISTPNEFISEAICNLHSDMASLAKKSVQEDPQEMREFSGVTIAVSEEGYDLAKKMIQNFRKEIHETLENFQKGQKKIVCQLNFQQFRLNQSSVKKEK